MTARPRQTDLSPQERAVAEAYALDDLRLPEVAKRVGIAAETAKSYLKRTREKYRERGVDVSSKLRLRAALLADQKQPPTPE